MVEAGSGRPFDGVAQVRITQAGTYYAVMRGGNNTGGLLDQYVLDVQIVPTGSVTFPNLQVTSVAAPTGGNIRSGDPVTISFTVKNVGSLPTGVVELDGPGRPLARLDHRQRRRHPAGQLRPLRRPGRRRGLHRHDVGQPARRHQRRLLPARRDRHGQRGQRVPPGGGQRHRLGRDLPRQPGALRRLQGRGPGGQRPRRLGRVHAGLEDRQPRDEVGHGAVGRSGYSSRT